MGVWPGAWGVGKKSPPPSPVYIKAPSNIFKIFRDYHHNEYFPSSSHIFLVASIKTLKNNIIIFFYSLLL